MSVQVVRFSTGPERITEVAEWAGPPVPPRPVTVLGRYTR